MNTIRIAVLFFISFCVYAELPVIPVPADQQMALLESDNPELAANKKLAYDFWRIVVVGRHVDEVDNYLTEGYMQHNPNAKTGRAGVKAFFRRSGIKPREIRDTIDDLVAIVAEGDLVIMAFAREYDDPRSPGEKYHTTWFDMFRVENGKLAEHWDPMKVAAP